MAVGVPLAWQKKIFLVIFVRRCRSELFWYLGMISVHHINHFVRTERQRVIAVFPFPFDALQKMNLVRLKAAVVVGIDQPVKASALGPVAADIKTLVSVEKAHRGVHRRLNFFNRFDLARSIQRDSEQRLVVVLRGNDQSALWVCRHANPRSFPELRGVKQLNFEPGQNRQRLGGRCLGGLQHVSPRFVSQFPANRSFAPRIVIKSYLRPIVFLFLRAEPRIIAGDKLALFVVDL